MRVVVNGEDHEIETACTVAQLLAANGETVNSAVVELNGAILRQEQWPDIVLQTGDKLEILVFMGGG